MRVPASTPQVQAFVRIFSLTSAALILLLPVLYFVIDIATGSLGRDLGSSSGSAINQLVSLALFLNAIILARLCNVRLRRIALVMAPAIVMLCWFVLSTGWSAYPDLTIRRTAREFIELSTFFLVALSIWDDRALLRVIFWSFLMILMFDIASMAFPGLSFTAGGFAGIHQTKNGAGLFFFYAIPVFAIGMLDRSISIFRIIAVAAIVCGLGLLYLSHSKSAMGVGAVALALTLLTRVVATPSVYGRMVLPLMCGLLVSLLALTVVAIGTNEVLVALFGDATFTGRDQLWRFALWQYDAHPVGGVGYGALWQVSEQVGATLRHSGVQWIANQAHNGYIDTLAQTGTVGLALLTAFLVFTLARLWRYTKRFGQARLPGLGDYALYLFFGAVIYNATESSFFRPGHEMWAMLIFVSARVSGHVVAGTTLKIRRNSPLRNRAVLSGTPGYSAQARRQKLVELSGRNAADARMRPRSRMPMR
jgi:O-antigen ligase